jgi:sRNA-binding regulator protein Hfq
MAKAKAEKAKVIADDELLEKWTGQRVRVVFLDGKVIGGILKAVGKYTLILKRGEGVFVVYKSAIKYLYREIEG